ncbi:MAG TPA: hypothetical protein VGD37_34745 [Kofleriaceae bacterium]
MAAAYHALDSELTIRRSTLTKYVTADRPQLRFSIAGMSGERSAY